MIMLKRSWNLKTNQRARLMLELTHINHHHHHHHHHHPYVWTRAIHLISSGNGGLTSSITLEVSEETSILDYQFYLITTTFPVAAYQE